MGIPFERQYLIVLNWKKWLPQLRSALERLSCQLGTGNPIQAYTLFGSQKCKIAVNPWWDADTIRQDDGFKKRHASVPFSSRHFVTPL